MYVVKTKALISCMVTAYAKNRFSHDAALPLIYIFIENKNERHLKKTNNEALVHIHDSDQSGHPLHCGLSG